MTEQHKIKMRGELQGKIALVAGAASGIGRATALMFAREGAVVICADRDAAGIQSVVAEICASGGIADAIVLDVTSEASWEAAMSHIAERHARLDVLVNSAGISFAKPVEEMSPEEWRHVLAVNVDGIFLGTKHAVRLMKQLGSGSIVNVASASGIRPAPGASAYSASKAAVIMFSKTIAAEMGTTCPGIRVNVVSPGGVKTPMWRTMPFFQELVRKTGSEEAAFAELVAGEPQGRFAEPEEIAEAVLYLASDAAAFVTGTNLVLDGGYTA